MKLPSTMSWLLDDAVLVGIPLMPAVVAALLYPAWLALRGDWRSWTVAPPVVTLRRQLPINHYPFSLLCAGLIVAAVMPSLLFEALHWEEARKFMWAVPFWIPAVPLMVSVYWWPPFLGPQWYRRWRAAGGARSVLPWTAEELAAAGALPEGRRKARILRNIDVSKTFVERALAQGV
ncbi:MULTISPECIES: hypothetical protein [Arthrobacter]|uniref:hypothetical protein n=1 Tax=Arthrobacter TaxID=1663 RepID=UPI000535E2A4|nr:MULTISPECIES: hypothetical protein [Arthrobacter]AIY03877.1 hypothetical protein ART_4278 [Arthrobacter sp. PAMC 25486]